MNYAELAYWQGKRDACHENIVMWQNDPTKEKERNQAISNLKYICKKIYEMECVK